MTGLIVTEVKGLTVTHRISEIQCNLSAQDWQLYTASLSCTAAAEALNKAFIAAATTDGASRSSVLNAMLEEMGRYADYGALDSEPLHVLDRLLEQAFS